MATKCFLCPLSSTSNTTVLRNRPVESVTEIKSVWLGLVETYTYNDKEIKSFRKLLPFKRKT